MSTISMPPRIIYAGALGFDVMSREAGRHLFFHCGARVFLLFNAVTTKSADGPLPTHGGEGDVHVAFAVSEDELPVWKDQLERSGIVIECDYRWPNGSRSLYFRDPAGNLIELTSPRIWGIEGDG